MNKSKSFGKDRPLEKGQQTLAAFFSKAKSLKTQSKCPVCLRQISTPKLEAHQKNCNPATRTPSFSKDDDDSDIEIIEDFKTPIKKPAPTKPSGASTKGAPRVKNGTAGSSRGADEPTAVASAGTARSSKDATESTSKDGSTSSTAGPTTCTAESTSVKWLSSSGEHDSTNVEATSSTNSAAESMKVTSTPCTSTPCKDDAPLWGRGSPQIADVLGGGIAAAFCETAWSQSDTTSDTKSEPDTPKIRCKAVSLGGWLVSPTRSPSVSPSGRVIPSPRDATPAVPSSADGSAGQVIPAGARVKLSPAVAGRAGRFAHSALLSEHLPPPGSPVLSQENKQRKSQSPRQGSKPSPWQKRSQSGGKDPGRSQGKSSGASPWKSPGRSPWKSPRQSPAQSPNRRLPKTNPLRYLNSPSSARRRLYRTTSEEGLGSTASSTGFPAGPSASSTITSSTASKLVGTSGSAGEPGSGQNASGDAGGGTEVDSAEKESEKESLAFERNAEKTDEETPNPGSNCDGGGRRNGLVKVADLGLLRCDSQDRLIGNFAIDSDGAFPCSPVSVSGVKDPASVPGTPTERVSPSTMPEVVDISNSPSVKTPSTSLTRSSTPTPIPEADLNLSVEEEEMLSQEFSSEMPEVALLSPKKPGSSQPYYLQNFMLIVDEVLSDALHANLLDAEDLGVISRLRALPSPAQMLYVRMFQRKHAWLRPEKLRYTEVGDEKATETALDQLSDAGLLDTDRELNGAVELAELLSAPELKQLCQQLHLTTTGPRSELLARLAELGKKKRGAVMFGATSPAEVAARRARTLLGRCVRVSSGPRRVLLRVLNLFHLPMYEDDEDTSQQLLTLLMVNLGRMVYPPVTVNKLTPIFATRDDLLRYEAASQIERQLRVAMETKQWDAAYDAYQAAETMMASLSRKPELKLYDATLPPFLRRFTASSIITYVLSKSVEVVQRRREHDAAVTLLCNLLAQKTYLPDYRGFWADRLALTLHQHLRKPDEALEAAKEALADPEVRGGRRLALEQRVARLEPTPNPKTLQPDHLPSVEIEARCLPRDVPGLKMVFLRSEHPAPDDPCRDVTGYVNGGDVTVCSVEELALSHYSSRYSEGVHREGAPTVTIFALLFWDLLYTTEVPDSFRSAYQTIPLDLNSQAFLERRREAVEARLTQLETGTEEEACLRAAEVWERHHDCLSLASWDVFRDCEHVLSLIRCLGMKLVTAICRRLATEYRFTRSGFPDLVLWDPATRSARIVEVKGPNDRLSTKQMLWIRYLLDHGAVAEVCYVRALGRRGAGRRKAEGKENEGGKRKKEETAKKRGRRSGNVGADDDGAVGVDDGNDVDMDCGEEVSVGRKRKGEGDRAGKAERGQETVSKKKRGRPRKPRPEEEETSASSGPSRAKPQKADREQAGKDDANAEKTRPISGTPVDEGMVRTRKRGRGRRNLDEMEDDTALAGAKRATKKARMETADKNKEDGESSREKRPRGRPPKRKLGLRAKEKDPEVVEVKDGESGERGATQKAKTTRGRRARGKQTEERAWSPPGLWVTDDSSGSDFA